VRRATLPPVPSAAAPFVLRGAVVRVRTVSVRTDPRAIVACAILTAVCALLLLLSVSFGEVTIGLPDAFAAIVGNGSSANEFFVNTLRLPRALSALLAGAAFGLSGAIFQTIARNPLASPDIIGITAGASAAAVAVIVCVGSGAGAVTLGALGGGLLTALAMYVLALRGGVDGYRLVLVGIGLGAMLSAITAYLLTRISIIEAQYAFIWLIGSLNGQSWEQLRLLAICLAVLVPLVLMLGRYVRLLEHGDDVPELLGVPVARTRVAVLLLGVALAAVATAVAGPIGFVALAAPQIGRRIVRSPQVTLVASALVGAVMVSAADLVGRVLPSVEMPVGVVTGIVGAPYLLWLLVRGHRTGELG
jgi:iron complex transport system permease protein